MASRKSEIIEVLDAPDHLGRRFALVEDLQLDFTMNQPLAPFAIAMIDSLDEESESLTLDTVSIIEAVLEDPRQILLAQQNSAKGELLAELKADGVEYTERMALLDEVTWPKPLQEDLEAALEIYARSRPWVRTDDLSPQVRGPRDLRDRADLQRVRAALRPAALRGHRAALSLRRLSGEAIRYLNE